VMGRFRIWALNGGTHEGIPGSTTSTRRAGSSVASDRSSAEILSFM
jgi:hypothetical protein